MTITQIKGAAIFGHSKWRQELNESKIDMGLMDPFSQEALDYSLYMAVIENDHDTVREMLAKGADPDMWVEAKAGESAGTLLHFAVRHNSLQSVIVLLQQGANPYAKDAAQATPRDIAQKKTSSNRMKTVLKLWEQRKTPPLHEEIVMNAEKKTSSAG